MLKKNENDRFINHQLYEQFKALVEIETKMIEESLKYFSELNLKMS